MGLFYNLFSVKLKIANSIDIIAFSFLINMSNINFLSQWIFITVSAIIIRKSLLNNIHTTTVESVMYLAGCKIYKILFINIIYNNFLYLVIGILLISSQLLGFKKFLSNFIILNLLITTSFLIRYIIPLYFFFRPTIISIIANLIYFGMFTIISITSENIKVVILLSSFLIISKTLNRALNYDDIRRTFK